MIDDLHYLTIADAARAIEAGSLSPVELTEAYLHRIGALDSTLGAYITVTAALARKAALEAEDAIGKGKYIGQLHGIPIGLKDLIDTAGIPTTWGTEWRRGVTAERDAVVTNRLADAGAVLLGKHALLEFAMGGVDHNAHYGYTRNPWNVDCFPGGSSSGTGSAVSAGLAAGGLGTDTGGSVRQPASYCGIVGLKPTNGLVNMEGIFPLSMSCDTVGPMARTAEDAAILLEGILGIQDGPYTGALASASLAGLRVGVPRAWITRDADEAVVAVIDAALAVFAGAGAEIVDVPLLPGDDTSTAYRGVTYYEAAAAHRSFFAEHATDYGSHVRQRLEDGQTITPAANAEAKAAASRLARDAERAMAGVDILALPTQPTPAPQFGQDQVTIAGEVFGMVAVRGRFTIPFNVYGWPGLSVPAGFAPDGLPVGLQLVGLPGRDAQLLAAGHAYQALTDWHQRHPSLG